MTANSDIYSTTSTFGKEECIGKFYTCPSLRGYPAFT